ncbi:MAG: cyclohexanecarboxylate-CoA ligase, partial [Mycolicibacterium hassiacum]
MTATDTFWELVERTAADHPDRLVLADDFGRTLTAAELRDAAESTAAALTADGIGPGTVVT